jgi:type II secretion system protein G
VIAIRKRLSGQKGFTLIELLVVVAILGILATVAVPRVMDAIDNARDKKAIADMTVIRDGLERFYVEYGVFPPALSWLATQKFIDPNFTFKNSYGNYYLYVVRWDGAAVAGTLSDYNMADPGKTPDNTIPFVNAATSFPVGLYDVTHHAYGWSTVIVAVGGVVSYVATSNTSGNQLTLTADLTAFTALNWTGIVAEPVPTTLKWAYVGQ